MPEEIKTMVEKAAAVFTSPLLSKKRTGSFVKGAILFQFFVFFLFARLSWGLLFTAVSLPPSPGHLLSGGAGDNGPGFGFENEYGNMGVPAVIDIFWRVL
jgi:hypothetical protein